MISGQLKLLNPVTATYTDIGTAQPSYNAMGYNVEDNFLYAMSTAAGDAGELLRIASDGSITPLGVPAGLPAASYVAGDFDNAGHLIIRSTATTWYSIDVATDVATTLNITGAADAGNDVVWINGVMYELNATTLYAVDLSTDVATSATVSGIVSGSFGAAWSDNPNELYFSDNGTGHIYKITGFTGASPAGTLALTGTVTSNNDGAACKNADSPFDLPVANDDTYAVTSDIPLVENGAGGVLTNDVGTGLTAILHAGPTHGSLTLNANGSFTYTPNAGFFGPDAYTYSVQDQFGRDSAADATVTLNVSLPAAPNAVDDAYHMTADTALNQGAGGGVLINDTGTGVTVTSSTSPAHGTLTINADGSFLYTPTAGYSGADSFDYTDTDAFSRTSSATVSLTVNPVAANVSASGTSPAAIIVTPTAPIGVGPFTYTLTSTPPAGDGVASMDSSTGQITFTPAAGFTGVVPTFHYRVADAAADLSNTANIDLTVSAAAPSAVDDTYTTTANTAINQGAGGGVLSNDTGTGITVTGQTSPAHGTLTLNADGSFVYTPTSGYSGPDSFNYTITDAFSSTSSATVSLTVNPVAFTVGIFGDGPSAFSAPLPAGIGTGPLTYALTSAPPVGDGTASLNTTTGLLTFTPAAGFLGLVPTFHYTVTDPASDVSAPANINVTVLEPPAPVAVTDTYTTTADTAVDQVAAGGLLTNDTGATLTVSGHTSPSHGTVTINSDGSFLYTPTAGYSGPDAFDYTDTDAYGRTSSTTATFTVNPVALDVTGSGPGPGAIHATPPAPEGTGPFIYDLVTTPPAGDGTVTMDPTTGLITFAPAAGFHGTVPTFTYAVTDSSDDVSAAADINLTVGLPSAPVAKDVSGTTPANTPITVTPAAPTGSGPFTFTLATFPSASDGVATIDPSTGAVTFTPAHGFSGIVPSFTYTVTDGDDQVSGPADVSIDVTPLDAPASGAGPAGQPITVLPPAPVGTGPFTYTLVPGSLPPAADGSVTINATTGAITFTPAPGFTGNTTVEYTVMDADGLTSPPAVVTFDVSGATSVPSTGAVETPMLAGALLIVLGLLLVVGAVARRTWAFTVRG